MGRYGFFGEGGGGGRGKKKWVLESSSGPTCECRSRVNRSFNAFVFIFFVDAFGCTAFSKVCFFSKRIATCDPHPSGCLEMCVSQLGE